MYSVRTRLVSGLVVLAGAVVLAPTGSPALSEASASVPPSVSVCVPPPYAWIQVADHRYRLTAQTTRCYAVATDTGQIVGPAAMKIAPASRFVVRRGQRVQFQLAAEPVGAITLRVGTNGNTTSYRLDVKRNPVWRVQGAGGVMRLVTKLTVRGPAGFVSRRVAIYAARFVVR